MKEVFYTSVGKKFLVGLTGIGVAGFAFIHVVGNTLLFVGPEAFNRYSYQLTHNPYLLAVMEIGLAALFIAHFGLTFWLAIGNWRATPLSPYMTPVGDKNVSFASRTMIYTGALVFAFLVLHIWSFRLGPYYSVIYDGVEMRDIYRLVVECFENPYFVGWYILCLVFLGFHLSHGISSVFQSLGLMGSNRPILKKLAYAYVILVIGCFISQPLIIFFLGGR